MKNKIVVWCHAAEELDPVDKNGTIDPVYWLT
jgi:hypothetical protein